MKTITALRTPLGFFLHYRPPYSGDYLKVMDNIITAVNRRTDKKRLFINPSQKNSILGHRYVLTPKEEVDEEIYILENIATREMIQIVPNPY